MAETDEDNVPLSGTIKSMLEDYFNDLDGTPPADLYQMVLQEMEQPLLETVLHYTRGNQSKAAVLLGPVPLQITEHFLVLLQLIL